MSYSLNYLKGSNMGVIKGDSLGDANPNHATMSPGITTLPHTIQNLIYPYKMLCTPTKPQILPYNLLYPYETLSARI